MWVIKEISMWDIKEIPKDDTTKPFAIQMKLILEELNNNVSYFCC
jgi:hypothetical protein